MDSAQALIVVAATMQQHPFLPAPVVSVRRDIRLGVPLSETSGDVVDWCALIVPDPYELALTVDARNQVRATGALGGYACTVQGWLLGFSEYMGLDQDADVTTSVAAVRDQLAEIRKKEVGPVCR